MGKKCLKTVETGDARRAPELLGKDEMNFAEFPLGFLSERVPKGCDSFVVEDEVRFRGELVTRRLSAVPAKGYGFPVAKDREIISACMQVTKKTGFPEDGRVPFSRYEMLETLQWDHGGGQYKRLAHGMEKLKFTGYKWENSWWDNEAKEFCDHSFSLFDNVVFAPSDRKRRQGRAQPLRTSWFKWNEVILASFKAGFLKDLDMSIYRSLSSLLAKEMFSLLDKNFYWKERLEYNVHEFAFHKLGVRGTSYEGNVAKLKDMLREPIEELVSCGIVKANSKRFFRDKAGDWQVIFEKDAARKPTSRSPIRVNGDVPGRYPPEKIDLVITSLRKRGLSKEYALLCASNHTRRALRTAIAAMDEQVGRGKRIRHPDKWFAAALEKGFESTEEFKKSSRRPDRRIVTSSDFR